MNFLFHFYQYLSVPVSHSIQGDFGEMVFLKHEMSNYVDIVDDSTGNFVTLKLNFQLSSYIFWCFPLTFLHHLATMFFSTFCSLFEIVSSNLTLTDLHFLSWNLWAFSYMAPRATHTKIENGNSQ